MDWQSVLFKEQEFLVRYDSELGMEIQDYDAEGELLADILSGMVGWGGALAALSQLAKAKGEDKFDGLIKEWQIAPAPTKINPKKIKDVTSQVFLAILSGETATIRRRVANNPNTHISTLRLLAYDKDDHVREYVAQAHSLPQDLINRFLKDQAVNVRRAILKNPLVDKDVLAEFAKSENIGLRRSVAINPNTPSEVLDELANDPNSNLVALVATNNATSTHTLGRLLLHKDRGVYMNALRNKNHLEKDVIKMVNSRSLGAKDLATLGLYSKKAQLQLIESSTSIRKIIAQRTNYPEVLGRLLEQKYSRCWEDLASNPSISKEIQLTLAKSNLGLVWERLANNTNIQEEIALILFHKGRNVRMRLANNPRITSKIAILLASCEDIDIRKTTLHLRQIPLAVLVESAKEEELIPSILSNGHLEKGELVQLESILLESYPQFRLTLAQYAVTSQVLDKLLESTDIEVLLKICENHSCNKTWHRHAAINAQKLRHVEAIEV